MSIVAKRSPISAAAEHLSSYLSGSVVVDGVSSKVTYIICSMPLGSVLGSVLFILYVASLANIVAEHNMSPHAYTLTMINFTSVANRKTRSRRYSAYNNASQ